MYFVFNECLCILVIYISIYKIYKFLATVYAGFGDVTKLKNFEVNKVLQVGKLFYTDNCIVEQDKIYSISPNLPLGIVFDETSSCMHGIPKEKQKKTLYTVKKYEGNKIVDLFTLYITVYDMPTVFSYPFSVLKITPLKPTTFSPLIDIEIDSFAIYPEELPSNIYFNKTNGDITIGRIEDGKIIKYKININLLIYI